MGAGGSVRAWIRGSGLLISRDGSFSGPDIVSLVYDACSEPGPNVDERLCAVCGQSSGL